MATGAVLTGDLIRSRESDDTQAYVDSLKLVLKALNQHYGIKAETFRGDGFQVVPKRPAQALHCALALRAGLIASSAPGERRDARVAVGIGQAQGSSGFGEAFVLSGQGLDTMKKSTLAVFSSNVHLLERIGLATEFAAAIIDEWTVVEAQTFYVHLLQGVDQKTTAQTLGKSRISVNKALQRAHARLLDRYLGCAQDWVEELADA
ncbi:hypothetical protein SAMN05444172_5915 [Burkholderia sp. GAS332]|uniref:hypothetical protein n=1 Tax=Paraburkholderia sp. TaxID=1926495 RepID=UPI0009298AC9|nr:hypothetical protein SAMN05444172_5915 [Burkholderia sp. GAS332]